MFNRISPQLNEIKQVMQIFNIFKVIETKFKDSKFSSFIEIFWRCVGCQRANIKVTKVVHPFTLILLYEVWYKGTKIILYKSFMYRWNVVVKRFIFMKINKYLLLNIGYVSTSEKISQTAGLFFYDF